MKRIFSTLLFFAIVGMAMAQGVKTYSIYDTNQSGDITIADVTATVNQVKSSVAASSTQQYVTADELATLLKDIQSDLKAIKEKLSISNVSTDYQYVDLGLPTGTLWATFNIGASKPEDYGLYFAWGETTGHSSDYVFSEENYKYYNYDSGEKYIEKYNNLEPDDGTITSISGVNDKKTTLDPIDDAATYIWGTEWRMPTKDELQELYDNCTWEWTSRNSVYGYNVIGTNGNSIFLPAAGHNNFGVMYLESEFCILWSSTLYERQNDCAYQFVKSERHDEIDSAMRDSGNTIRPVRNL